MPSPGRAPHGGSGPRTGWLAPAATGILLVLAFPPFSLAAAPFLALSPMAVVIGRSRPGLRSAGARMGFAAGLVAWAMLVYWVPVALGPVTRWGVPFYVLLVCMLATMVALFGWLAHGLHHGAGVPLWLAVPVAWTASEWLRAHLGPLSFPWLELGVALAAHPRVAGLAELVGGRGLGFWLALCGGLTASALTVPAGRRRTLAWVVLVVAVAVPAGWSAWRFGSLGTVPVLRVAVVQPNLTRSGERGDAAGLDAVAAVARALDTLPSVDLVVWPEGVLAHDPRADTALGAAVGTVVDAAGAPTLLGAYLDVPANGGWAGTANGALLWSPGTGASGAPYHKRRLVPGVETVPFLAPRGAEGFRAGGPQAALVHAGLPPLAVLICYESLFAADAREVAGDPDAVLVNLTNDAWFGGRGGERPTWALWQHPAHLVLRAIELRTGAVRAANTGISLFVDPLGRVTEETLPFRPDLVVGTVWGVPGRTVFARTGDVVGLLSVLSCLAGLLVGALKAAPGRPRPGGRRSAGGGTLPTG